ncbi:MAG: retropepsin-like aspartic protease [Candidatus Omnitrophota bacterium]
MAEIIGPKQNFSLKMIVDTGATYTMIPKFAAVIIGIDLQGRNIKIATGTKVERATLVNIPLFRAFGVEFRNFPVLVHDLPPQIKADGLLGLNFLKKSKAIIDFSKNSIKFQ